MKKFLAALVRPIAESFSPRCFSAREEQRRQETIKAMNDEINRQIEMGEAATFVPDSDR